MSWGAIGAAAIGLVGSQLTKSKGGGDKTTTTGSGSTSTKPWSELVPYLTGGGMLPSYISGTSDIYGPWLDWAQAVGEGTNLSAPPPMMADYVRALQGIGTAGGNPVSENQSISSMPTGLLPQPQQQPQPVAQPQYQGGGYPIPLRIS